MAFNVGGTRRGGVRSDVDPCGGGFGSGLLGLGIQPIRGRMLVPYFLDRACRLEKII